MLFTKNLILFVIPLIITNTLVHAMYNDDDYIPNDEKNINYGYGKLDINLQIFNNEQCIPENFYAKTSGDFYYPDSCTCVNSKYYCNQRLISTDYFQQFNWSQNIKPIQTLNSNYNISYCILQNRLRLDGCIPCDNFSIIMNGKFTRGICLGIDLLLIFVFFSFSILVCSCMYSIFKGYRNRRNEYQLIDNANSNRKYRFFTISS